MSAFSRGFLLRHQCALQTPRTAHFFPSRSYQQPRFFSSSSILQAAKKARASPPLKKAVSRSKAPPSPLQTSPLPSPSPILYQTYASTLAQKSHPTLLYQAPSHTYYMLACYGTAGFCFTYAVVCFWSNYLLAPPDIAAWVPVAFGGVSFLMAALGGWLVLGPARLVRSISAVPRGLDIARGAVAKSAAQAQAQAQAPQLQIEIELKKMFPVPFFPARKMYVRPEEVTLPHRFVPVDRRASIEEAREVQRMEREEKRRLEEHYRAHRMSWPLRRMGTAFSQASFGIFSAMKRTWTRDGMMKVDVQGQIYKVDITAGWALDGGRALDRLAKVKP